MRRVKSEKQRRSGKNEENDNDEINVEKIFGSKSLKNIDNIEVGVKDEEEKSIKNKYGRLPPVEIRKKRFLDFDNDNEKKVKVSKDVLLSRESMRRKESDITEKKSDLYLSNKFVI